MTPPAHLLPLALEAMHSADACEVLGDALLESGWCDWRYIYVRTDTPVPREPIPVDLGTSREVLGYFLEDPRSSVYAPHQVRAIAAVLLFGEWSTTRWPLVEAHEAQLGDLWVLTGPGRLLGIDREESPTRLAGMTPTLDASTDIVKPYWQIPAGKPKAPQRWWDGATRRRGVR